MKIAISGFGGMGKLVKSSAEAKGHHVVACIDPVAKGATAGSLSKEALHGAEVVIDFSHPRAAFENITRACEAGVSMVMGTTGWYDRLEQARGAVSSSGIGFLYSPNFSIGVHIYLRLVEEAAKIIDAYPDYDIWGHEIHHHNKVDSPSGTAKAIEKLILKHVERKKAVVEDKLDRKIEPHEFHYSSTRGGPVNFAHTLALDSAADTVTITHSARSRAGYADGAIIAAEWLCGRKGFFGMDDLLKSR